MIMGSGFDFLEYFYYNFSFLDPGMFFVLMFFELCTH